MGSRMLRRLRRRGNRVCPCFCIVLSDGAGSCLVIEVARTYRPTRQARALMEEAFIHVEIVWVG
jgi:hypothetical protein